MFLAQGFDAVAVGSGFAMKVLFALIEESSPRCTPLGSFYRFDVQIERSPRLSD
jgi:hypothetical protein